MLHSTILIPITYQYKLCPNKEQERYLKIQLGHCRFVYNAVLDITTKEYKEDGTRWNYYKYQNMLPGLKEEYPFFKEAIAQSLQVSVRRLDLAFKSFFNKKASFPRFKKKSRTHSFTVPQKFKIEGNKVK